MAEQQQANIKNEKIGQVVSTKMTKTIVVEVSRRVPHPLYRRIIGKRKKFYAHDEEVDRPFGRRGAHRRMPAVEQAEAVDAGRSGAPRRAGGRAAGGAGREGLKKEDRSRETGVRMAATARPLHSDYLLPTADSLELFL